MAADKRVLCSIETVDGGRCVDLFIRTDGTYGFEEYRRDVEDARGWFAIGGYANLIYATDTESRVTAIRSVPWLSERLTLDPQ